jgi:ABC-type nitrate/sulfonate/bicarbonate transport system permease component
VNTGNHISLDRRALVSVFGAVALPCIWLLVKYGFGIEDRFLPSPMAVLQALQDIQPSVWLHLAYTGVRLTVGYSLGVVVGVLLALAMVRNASVQAFLTPMLQAMRPVPAAAVVPFFLLWFGFSEWGRYLLVLTAIAFNIAIAAWQIFTYVPDNHAAFFHSFHLSPGKLLRRYALPRIAESILPTLRFSMALAVGAVTVSELLGSQIGLGYLIQTSRSTFSLHVLFLVAILLGVVSAAADGLLVLLWRRLIFWRRTP